MQLFCHRCDNPFSSEKKDKTMRDRPAYLIFERKFVFCLDKLVEKHKTMDSPQYEYVNEDQISPQLKCSICLSPFIEPYCTPCRHTFCRLCITSWLQRGEDSCPRCRGKLSLRDITPASHDVCSLVDDLQVKCFACKQTGIQRGQFQAHLDRSCPRRNDQVGPHVQPTVQHDTSPRNLRCSSNGCSSDLNSAQCSHCQRYFCSTHLTEHRRQCRRQKNSAALVGALLLAIVFIILIIAIFYPSKTKTPLSKPDRVSQNDPIALPMSCSDPSQCPTRQVPFTDSQLLTGKHQHYLNYFYNPTRTDLSKWNLIYRGSKDGFNALAFHTHCDNKGETLIVLSTTKGYLFGGYTDAPWTTPAQGLPTYGRSAKTFLFSLTSHQKGPARKFSLDARHQNYAIVNDFLSGPIFGAIMRPDIGISDANGEFRCQINFPSLYRGGVGESYFPTSDDCIIDEIEVFSPVFGRGSSVIYGFFRLLFGLVVTIVTCLLFFFVDLAYEQNRQVEARWWAGICLYFFWMNYLWGYLLLSVLIFSLILCIDWMRSSESPVLEDLRTEKRRLLSFFFILLVYVTFFR